MASGVFAARATRQPSAYGDSDPANAMVRQVHDLVDNIARVFPALWNGAPQWAAPAIATPNTRNADAIATVRAPSPVRPGDSGTISMTLRNDESRPVELMPVATDLVGPTGIRISLQRLEFVPAHVRLAPGEQTDVQCRVTVPAEAAAGCYVGLLVVCGLEYLRALMSVEVTAG
jgi:hypothetical protein